MADPHHPASEKDAVRILHEDNHLLVVHKPSGWLTMGDATGDVSLAEWAQADLKHRYRKPGKVFIGVVHRLDRPVSGIVVLAKTSKAAARLSAQFRERSLTKTYWAVLDRPLQSPAGTLVDFLEKDAATNRTRRVSQPTSQSHRAELSYQQLEDRGGFTLLEVQPQTGRGHQIRVQLQSHLGPIVGDVKYGSRVPFLPEAIALHAVGLTFRHPTQAAMLTIHDPSPTSWSRWGFRAVQSASPATVVMRRLEPDDTP